MTWHAIDDPEHPAPKDGTRILLAQGENVEVGRWIADELGHYETISERHGRRVQEWVSTSKGHWSDVEHIYDPTHWMPLPDPPPKDEGK